MWTSIEKDIRRSQQTADRRWLITYMTYFNILSKSHLSSFNQFNRSNKQCVFLFSDDHSPKDFVVAKQLCTHFFTQLYLNFSTLVWFYCLRVATEYCAIWWIKNIVNLCYSGWTFVCCKIYHYFSASQHRNLKIKS